MAGLDNESTDVISSTDVDTIDPEVGWECGSQYYELLERVGKGAFAEVFAARCSSGRREGTGVAIKIIDLDGISSNLEDIRQEVATLRLCNHPNVLRFYASFVEQRTKHELWLITQLLEKGSCLHVMTEAKKMGMPAGMHEDWLVWIVRESLNGLRYFHEHQQIHRDIKAGNILLDGKGRVALADFGVSRWINGALNNSSNDGRAKTFVGTPCWMAPEVMEQLDGYDFKADIWSLGITALELAKGHAPYSSFPPMKVLLYTIQNEPPSLSSYPDGKRDNIPFSRSFRDLVRMCLQKDPSKRPTCAKLLTHALFTQKEPTAQPLVADLLDKMRNFGDVSSLPETEDFSSSIDFTNMDTARAGGSGGQGIVHGAAGLEAAMNDREAAESAQRDSNNQHRNGDSSYQEGGGGDASSNYPQWSFGDSDIREALREAGVVLPTLAESTPFKENSIADSDLKDNDNITQQASLNENQTTFSDSRMCEEFSDQSESSGSIGERQGTIGSESSSSSDQMCQNNSEVQDNHQPITSARANGGSDGSELNQGDGERRNDDGEENNHSHIQEQVVSRADQDAYVSAMGGALELMSEEEIDQQSRSTNEIDSKGNDEVFAFINQIGSEFGGEFKEEGYENANNSAQDNVMMEDTSSES